MTNIRQTRTTTDSKGQTIGRGDQVNTSRGIGTVGTVNVKSVNVNFLVKSSYRKGNRWVNTYTTNEAEATGSCTISIKQSEVTKVTS